MFDNLHITLDPFTITLIFIVVSAIIAALVKGRKKDKCLKDFRDFQVTLQKMDGKTIWGRLSVETTGMELCYCTPHMDAQGHIETSYLFYRNEYSSIQALVRFIDDMDDSEKKKRHIELKRTYHPGFFRILGRRFMNLFRTLRDSFVEVINLVLVRAKNLGQAGQVLSGQDKYVNQMKSNLIDSVSTAYEPLLEKHIGKKMVFEIMEQDKPVEYCAVLKEYSADFIEFMDINYTIDAKHTARQADIVVPRVRATVRHLAE